MPIQTCQRSFLGKSFLAEQEPHFEELPWQEMNQEDILDYLAQRFAIIDYRIRLFTDTETLPDTGLEFEWVRQFEEPQLHLFDLAPIEDFIYQNFYGDFGFSVNTYFYDYVEENLDFLYSFDTVAVRPVSPAEGKRKQLQLYVAWSLSLFDGWRFPPFLPNAGLPFRGLLTKDTSLVTEPDWDQLSKIAQMHIDWDYAKALASKKLSAENLYAEYAKEVEQKGWGADFFLTHTQDFTMLDLSRQLRQGKVTLDILRGAEKYPIFQEVIPEGVRLDIIATRSALKEKCRDAGDSFTHDQYQYVLTAPDGDGDGYEDPVYSSALFSTDPGGDNYAFENVFNRRLVQSKNGALYLFNRRFSEKLFTDGDREFVAYDRNSDNYPELTSPKLYAREVRISPLLPVDLSSAGLLGKLPFKHLFTTTKHLFTTIEDLRAYGLGYQGLSLPDHHDKYLLLLVPDGRIRYTKLTGEG